MKAVQNKRAIVVGIFIFFGIAILMAGILVLGGQRKTFEKTITLNAIFNDVGGLQKGNNIWFSGVKVGTVKRLKLLSQTQVQVEMRIEKQTEDFIRKDSKAKIGSDGLIGNRIVIVYGGSPSVPRVKAGDTLQTEVPISSACVARKTRKIGVRIFTDSFTPRRFSAMRSTIAATSTAIFHSCSDSGRKLKMALPPEAIETVMVRM